eukprot:190747-Pyramimonas_sp.AAC.1
MQEARVYSHDGPIRRPRNWRPRWEDSPPREGEVSVKCSEARQNPNKSEEHQRHLQGVLYIV